MASTSYRCFGKHVELCFCARKKKNQTINAESRNSVRAAVAAALFAIANFFAGAFRRREEEVYAIA